MKNKEKIETVKTERDILQDSIIDFVNNMRGKSRATLDEQKIMFSLYNQWFGTIEQNYGCDLCAIRIFSRLEKLVK